MILFVECFVSFTFLLFFSATLTLFSSMLDLRSAINIYFEDQENQYTYSISILFSL